VPIARSRLKPPSLRSASPRPRLAGGLGTLSAGDLVWVFGPPGAGKSFFVAAEVESRAWRPLWYAWGDHETPASFAEGMALALAEAGVGQSAPCADGDWAGWAGALAAEVGERDVLVFDGLPEYAEEEVVQAWLEILTEWLAEIAVVVVSRFPPAGAWLDIVPSARLQLFDAAGSLAFDREEVRALMDASPGEADNVQRLTCGWAAGVGLWAALRQGSRLAADEIELRVLERFERNAWAALDPEVQRIVAASCLLPEVDADRLARLGCGSEAIGKLRALANRGAFVQRLPEAEDSYTYHPLLTRVAGAVMAREADTNSRSGRIEAMAEALASEGRQVEAIDLCLAHAEYDAAGAIFARHAPRLVGSGASSEDLVALAARIPDAALEAAPACLLVLAESACIGQETRALVWAEQAYRQFVARGDQAACVRAASAALLALETGYSPLGELDLWLERLNTHFEPALPLLDEAARLRVMAASVLALAVAPTNALCLQRAQALADALYKEFEAHCARLAIWEALLGALACLSYYAFRQPDSTRLEILIQRAYAAGLVDRAPLALRFEWLYYEIEAMRTRGRRESAIHTLAALEDCAASLGLGSRRVAALFLRGQLKLDAGEIEPALAASGEALTLFRQDGGRMLPWVYKLRARCSLQLGRHAEAKQAAQKALEAAVVMRIPTATHDQFLGELFFAQAGAGAWREAREIAERSAASCTGRMREVWSVYGQMCHALEVDTAARRNEILSNAFAAARELDWPSFFVALPGLAGKLCALALSSGIERGFALSVIRQRALIPESFSEPVWPWRLRVRMLEGFTLELDDKPLGFGPKPPKKPLELLRLLAVMPHMEADCRYVAEAIWPGEDGARKSLEVTVARLRKFLGDDELVRMSGGRVGLDSGRVWCDLIWARERLADVDRIALGNIQGDELDDALASLAQTDPGRLTIAEDEVAAVIAACEQFRANWSGSVVRLAESLIRAGRPAGAVRLLESAIAVEPGAEATYRALMRCHIALGQMNDAVVVFRRCRQMLSVLLGMQPSPEMLRLRDQCLDAAQRGGTT